MEILSINFLFVFIIVVVVTSSAKPIVDPQIGFYGVPEVPRLSGPIPISEVGFEGGLYDGYRPEFRKYSYDYGVSDPYTGDHKKVWEEAYGNGVKVRFCLPFKVFSVFYYSNLTKKNRVHLYIGCMDIPLLILMARSVL